MDRQDLKNAINELKNMLPEKERAYDEAKADYEDCLETLTRYEAELEELEEDCLER